MQYVSFYVNIRVTYFHNNICCRGRTSARLTRRATRPASPIVVPNERYALSSTTDKPLVTARGKPPPRQKTTAGTPCPFVFGWSAHALRTSLAQHAKRLISTPAARGARNASGSNAPVFVHFGCRARLIVLARLKFTI